MKSSVPMQKLGAGALHTLGEQVQKLAGSSISSAKAEGDVNEENVETPDSDQVFVPHYEVYAIKKKQYAPPLDSPPSVLPPSGFCNNQFWLSSGEGSSMSSVDNYDQTASVNMHQRLSEFQVAVRASEMAREEGQRETDSLRVYVGTVEAAAAGVLSRVQDLEHLLALSSVVKHGHDIDQLRGKVATAATHEMRRHAAAAAQAVAAAREATMELDKVRRETNALTRAQQLEIEKLNVEATEARILHEARALQSQDLLNQNGKLERRWEDMNSRLQELQATHKAEYAALHKKYQTIKTTARANRMQNLELKKALEINLLTVHSLQKKCDDMQVEQKELTLQKELLEQHVMSLQGEEMSSTIALYDYELHKLREATSVLTEGYFMQISGDEGHLGSDVSSTASVAGPSSKSSGAPLARESKANDLCPPRPLSKDEGQISCGSKQQPRSPNGSAGSDDLVVRTNSAISSKLEQDPQALLICKANMLILDRVHTFER